MNRKVNSSFAIFSDLHVLKLIPASLGLLWCCILTLQRSLYAVIVPRLVQLAFTICQPLVLNRLLIYLEDESQSEKIGYGLIGAYGLVYVGIAASQALYHHRNGRSTSMLRGILISAVFGKATEISITTADTNAPVTLMSSDVSFCDLNILTR